MYIHTYIHVCSYKLLSALDALQCRSVALAIYRRRCTARKDTADGVGYGRGCYGIGYGLSQRHLAATIGSIVNTWPVRARCVTECRCVCVCVGVSAGVDVLVYFTGLNIYIDITVMTACHISQAGTGSKKKSSAFSH